jgi:cytochrome c553
MSRPSNPGQGMLRRGCAAASLAMAMLLAANAAYAQRDDDAGPYPSQVREAYDDSPEAISERSGSGDPVAGRQKSFLCQGCHGTEGVSAEPLIPNLAGQYGNYIAKEIHDFQAGKRSHQIMNGMAATIQDDRDLADIAAYFASQPKMESDSSSPGNPLGESIFMHGDLAKGRLPCFGCHGIRGKGDAPTSSMFPVIGGQKREYIHGQLMNFRAGIRTNSPAGIMNLMTKYLTDEEIDALADYISSQ